MIEISQVSTPIDEELSIKHIANKLSCQEKCIHDFTILKESIDARKNNVKFIYTVLAQVDNEEKFLHYQFVKRKLLDRKAPLQLLNKMEHPPIVVGFGPAGMFAALRLAMAGCNPIVIERGSAVDKRVEDVENFWNNKILNNESNVQFGEGGAGTFSDGKLTTRIKDEKVSFILNALVDAKADKKILYQAHPHIGTDKLREIVKNIRNRIIELGGKIYFDTKFISFKEENNKKLVITNKQSFICNDIILCIGHSAKDTIKQLHYDNIKIEPKNFAVGLRIEHLQELIDKQRYHSLANHPRLKSAEYRLSHTSKNKRGVYTFCMCPGGLVIPSSCDDNLLVVNGMSNSKRDQKNANSAILVQVFKEDYYKDDVMDGFRYLESLEKQTFELGGSDYSAPIQTVQDFINNKITTKLNKTKPSYCMGVKFANLRDLFSDEINEALIEGLNNFNTKIKGFSEDAILTAVESKSSCPIRILRNEYFESVSHPGIYPCGEGAGYAGGIISSGVDGVRCAEALIMKHNKK
ncbi:MAG: NAD(P)/FAD-dependent oxidoreductase [Anaerorhabdus sp.]